MAITLRMSADSNAPKYITEYTAGVGGFCSLLERNLPKFDIYKIVPENLIDYDCHPLNVGGIMGHEDSLRKIVDTVNESIPATIILQDVWAHVKDVKNAKFDGCVESHVVNDVVYYSLSVRDVITELSAIDYLFSAPVSFFLGRNSCKVVMD